MKYIHLTLTGLLIISIVLSVQAQSKKEVKELAYRSAIEEIETGAYEFKGIRAYPQKGGQVDLLSRPNFLKVNGVNASADMPYFGQLTGGAASYGSGSGGIVFDNEMIDYAVKKNDKKQRMIITLKVRSNTESFSCTLTVNSMTSASLVITSSNRQSIRYSGSLVGE